MQKKPWKSVVRRSLTGALTAALVLHTMATPTLTVFAADADTAVVTSASDLQKKSEVTSNSDLKQASAPKSVAKSRNSVSATKANAAAVSYLDASGAQQTCSTYTEVTSETTDLSAGWYLVSGAVTVSSRITVTGEVHLILADDASLTASSGISVSTGSNSLTIYAQSTGDSMGKLTAASDTNYYAAIGGYGREKTSATRTAGDITINGGNISATVSDGKSAAAIGGGYYGGADSITVNGGIVNATAGRGGKKSANGSAIGGGYHPTSDTLVTINGGTVNASGGRGTPAIGSESTSPDYKATVRITGGVVNADDCTAVTTNASSAVATIGGRSAVVEISGGKVTVKTGTKVMIAGLIGVGGNGSTVNISGGTVDVTLGDKSLTASGNSHPDCAIGGYSNTSVNGAVNISGGTVTAKVLSEKGGKKNQTVQMNAIGAGTVKVTGGNVNASYDVVSTSGLTLSGVRGNTIELKHSAYTDTVFATSYSVNPTLNSDFTFLDDANVTQATGSTVANKTIVPRYKVVFYNEDNTEYQTTYVESKKTTSVPSLTKTGYTLSWVDMDDSSVFTSSTAVKKDTNLIATWTVNQYTITFDTDGGSPIDAITQDYNTAITAPDDPTKEGYTFAGWTPDVPATMPAENLTVKAQWAVNQYTITFDTDGGSPIDPITQDYNTAITKPADPTKGGYTFAGWDKDIPATMPAENLTVKANWTVSGVIIESRTVSFEGIPRLVYTFTNIPGDILAADDVFVSYTRNSDSIPATRIKLSNVLKTVTVEGQTKYKLYYDVPAAEYADTVTMRLDQNGSPITIYSKSSTSYPDGIAYSIKEYAVNKTTEGSTEAMRNLAKALNDYGTAAQINFVYGDYASLSVSDEVSSVTEDDLSAYQLRTEGTKPAGFKGAAISVLFESDNTLRIYFYFDGSKAPEDYQYKIDEFDENIVKKVTDNGTFYILEVKNIAAPELDEEHSFSISDGTDTYTVHASALSYAKTSIAKGTEARQNLGKALYLYNKAANEYFK